MNKSIAAFVILCGTSAFAWNCPTGQIRQQAPAGTPTTAPYYDVVEGIAFICVPATPTMTPSTTPSTSATSTSSATGGNASAAATGGNSTNTNNNISTNTLSQTQKQQQSQSQSNTSTNDNQSQGGSVSDVGNSSTVVEAPKIPVASAYAPPVFSSANCFKGFSGGVQTAVIGGSFGGGGIDRNCAALATSQNLYAMGSRKAACKVIITTKAAKDAGVTLADCMAEQPRPVVVAQPVVQPAPSITVNVPPAPAAQLIYLSPREQATVTAPKPLGDVKPASKKHVSKPCKVPASLQTQEK